MMARRLVPIVLVLMLALAACAAPSGAPAAQPVPQQPADATPGAAIDSPAPGLETVRVGHVPVTIYSPFYIAAEKGYFEEEGIAVEFTPVEGGTEMVVQVAAGNFDVAGGGIGAGLLNAVARGIEFEIAAPMHTEKPPLTSPFVVSKARFDSGELTSMADMAGKKVSTNSKGAATEYWLWSALQQGGLDFPDVEVLGVGYRDVPPALESGSLDGGILSEPLATLMEDQGLVARLSEDFIEGFTATYVYFNTDWSAANPDLAQRFIKAYLRGARDLNGDQWYSDENLAIIEKYTGVAADVVRRANRSYHDPNGGIPLADIERLEDFFRSQGELNYEEDLDLSSLVNTGYVDAALAELGGPVEWE